MNTNLQVYKNNVKLLADMVARIGEDMGECGLGPPKIFPVSGGEARVWKLFESESVTIAKAHLSAGAVFPVHKHGTAEFIVVFSGEAWFTSEAGEELLGPGDCVKVFVGTPHSVKAGPGGAWFSVTTVPREEGLTYGR